MIDEVPVGNNQQCWNALSIEDTEPIPSLPWETTASCALVLNQAAAIHASGLHSIVLMEENDMSITIYEHQRGLLFRKGRLAKVLTPGRHHFTLGKVEILPIDKAIESRYSKVELLCGSELLKKWTTSVHVPDGSIVVHYVNGIYREVLRAGEYLFWNVAQEHEFKHFDLTQVDISEALPKAVLAKLPNDVVNCFVVPNEYKGVLSIDSSFSKILEPGIYYYWKEASVVQCALVDARKLQIDITGQEILTADRVSLRMNLTCSYRIVDFRRFKIEIGDFNNQLHVLVQLAIREFVGKMRFDEILENKDKISEFLLQSLKNQEAELFIEVLSAGVKDIILPGEIREIMNTVLVAEKRAQANVITRREEVASTRSLLNTAKMMEDNPVLMKLKELEYLERIFEHVGAITLNNNSDVTTQLLSLIQSQKKS